MSNASLPAAIGASVNASPTIPATARAFGTAAAPAPTNPSRDTDTLVSIGGGVSVPLKAALAMGLLRRNAAGVVSELNRAAAPTRVNF